MQTSNDVLKSSLRILRNNPSLYLIAFLGESPMFLFMLVYIIFGADVSLKVSRNPVFSLFYAFFQTYAAAGFYGLCFEIITGSMADYTKFSQYANRYFLRFIFVSQCWSFAFRYLVLRLITFSHIYSFALLSLPFVAICYAIIVVENIGFFNIFQKFYQVISMNLSILVKHVFSFCFYFLKVMLLFGLLIALIVIIKSNFMPTYAEPALFVKIIMFPSVFVSPYIVAVASVFFLKVYLELNGGGPGLEKSVS